MRIAVAGFMHESNTFNRLLADREAFRDQNLTLGPGFVDEWRDAHHEVGGFIESVSALGHELVPVGMAWATPSGPVADDVFNEVTDYLARELTRLCPDGVLLALHGAMVAQSHRDADGEVLSRLRPAVGPDLPIVVTLDLHGNISERPVDHCTAAIAYQTCPHVDQRAQGKQAAALLDRVLRTDVHPRQALAKPPVIVNIMVHDTSEEPLR